MDTLFYVIDTSFYVTDTLNYVIRTLYSLEVRYSYSIGSKTGAHVEFTGSLRSTSSDIYVDTDFLSHKGL